jgi:DNA-binding MarR family transcriptional regulator
MSGKLAREIKQTKAWSSLEEEVALNVQRTAAVLEQALEETLKPHGITATQYNALRIIRGSGNTGISCQEAGTRMIRTEPDLTRLFDRLEARDLVVRSRSAEDRRLVLVRLSPTGVKLLASLDGVVTELHKRTLGTMGDRKLRQLRELSEEARHFD